MSKKLLRYYKNQSKNGFYPAYGIAMKYLG